MSVADCPECTPKRLCSRHLLAALSATPRRVSCGCCGEIGCACQIGAITEVWMRAANYRGVGLVCLHPHYRTF